MFRTAILAALTLIPTAGQAQPLHLEAVFETACVEPFDLFFGETEDNLRELGFEIFPNDDWTTVERPRNGMQGFYSSNPEDMFCTIYDPNGNPETADRAAWKLLSAYFEKTPIELTPPTGVSAWGIPQGGCCHLVIEIRNRSPQDIPGGAAMALYLRDR